MRKQRVNGEKVRDLREYAWMSQGQLAEKAGVALHTVNRIERGHTPYPQNSTLKSIAEVLEVNPQELLHGKGGDEDANPFSDTATKHGIGDSFKRTKSLLGLG